MAVLEDGQRGADLHLVARLGEDGDTHRRVDRVFLPGPSRSQPHAGHSDRSGVADGHISGTVRLDRPMLAGRGQQVGVFDRSRVTALGIHHLHVWQLDEHNTALEAHVVIDKRDLEQMEEIKRAVKALLAERFAIAHSTLEFEFLPCEDNHDPLCFEKTVGAEV